MLHDDLAAITPLPRLSRLHDLEDPINFLNRLLADNGISTDVVRAQLNRWRLNGNRQRAAAQTALAERLSARPPGFFDRMRRRAQPLPDITYPVRWACTRCASGQAIPQVPHFHHEVCLRHERWIGPGTDPESQFQLGTDAHIVVKAARQIDRATTAGRTTRLVATRAWEMLRDDAYLSGDSHWSERLHRVKANPKARPGVHDRAALFPETVALALLLTDPNFLTKALAPQATDIEVRTLFRAAWPRAASVLVERVMLHLRPLRARATTFSTDPEWAVPRWGHEPNLATVDTSRWLRDPTFVAAGSGSVAHLFRPDEMPTVIARHPEILDIIDWVGRPKVDVWEPECPVTSEATFRCQAGHTWVAPIKRVLAGHGCSVCSGKTVVPGTNDLASQRPEIAKEWDEDANSRSASEVTTRSGFRAHWRCPLGHCYVAQVASRTTRGRGCPVCAGRTVLAGFNDLESQRPSVAALWDHDLNDRGPATVSTASSFRAHWRCSAGHRWQQAVSVQSGIKGCGRCRGNRPVSIDQSLAETHPELAAQWDDRVNQCLPSEITVRSRRKYGWRCDKGHGWSASVEARLQSRTCPVCDLRQLVPGVNDLATTHPELAAAWAKSNRVTAQQLMANSGKGVNWDCNGHTFFMPVRNRVAGTPCSKCARGITVGQRGKPIRPEILASWDYDNNPGVDPSTLYRKSPHVAWWKCEEGHRWQCAVASRARGTGCPTCHRQKRSAPIRGVTGQ